MRISKKLSALGALFAVAAAVAVAGCGSSIPSNSVASVAGNPISLQAFNHWMYVAAKDQAAQSPGSPVIVPNDPPEFTNCIKQIRAQIPSLAKVSDKTLKTECNQVFQQLKGEVMAFLIDSYWYQGDAYKAGIHMSDAQVAAAFAKAKKSEFSTNAAFLSYLKTTGETLEDLKYQIRVNQLYSKLIKRAEGTITAAKIAAYYHAHLTQFGTPKHADLHLVRTTSEANALAAYNALKSGESWDTVAKKYSASAAGRVNGGLITNVTSGEEEQAVNTAIFSTPVGHISQPIHGTFGWYVIEDTKIVPGTQESLTAATPTVKKLLTSQQQTAAQAAVQATAKKNWLHLTDCRETYSIASCNGYVAPKTTTTSAAATPTTSATTTTGAASTTGTSTSATSTKTKTTG
jgi:foldase protein PrsA